MISRSGKHVRLWLVSAMVRECDNDDCDYETYVDASGHPRVRWEHADLCEGSPAPLDADRLKAVAATHPHSFLAFLIGSE